MSFSGAAEKNQGEHLAPANSLGPAVLLMMNVLESKAGRDAAISTLEKTKPATKLTLSCSTICRVTCRPTSGLNWSSPFRISVGSPPSFPPAWSTASMNPSYMCRPSTPDGPENVETKPIFSVCCASARSENAAIAASIAAPPMEIAGFIVAALPLHKWHERGPLYNYYNAGRKTEAWVSKTASTVPTPASVRPSYGPPPHEKGPLVFRDYDQVELDAAYSQVVYAPNAHQIIDRYLAMSDWTRSRLGEPERLAYGPGEIETLDLYRAKRRDAPVLVFLHGGGWRSHVARDFAFAAETFVAAGVHFVAPDFAWVQDAGASLMPLA